jgi:hypothetical protein
VKTYVVVVVGCFSAACLDDIILPPDPPTLSLVSDVVHVKRPAISGTRTVDTEVLCGPTDDDGDAVVIAAVSASDAWSGVVPFDLVPFEDNAIFLWTRSETAGLSYEFLQSNLVFEPLFPDPPTVDGPLLVFATTSPVTLAGSKPAATGISFDDVKLVALNANTAWSVPVEFAADEVRKIAVVAVDARDHISEPVDVVIVFDTTPPDIDAANIFPPAAGTLARNGVVSVPLTEEVDVVGAGPPGLVRVLDGLTAVADGGVVYEPATHTLRIAAPAGGWPASLLTFRIDGSLVLDRAGNSKLFAPFQRTATAADDTSTPSAVVVTSPSPIPAVVTTSSITLSGTKSAPSSIVVDGVERVFLSDATTWTANVQLAVGAQTVRVQARSAAGVDGPEVAIDIERQQARPAAPVLSPAPPGTTNVAALDITGTREANTSIALDDEANVVVPRGAATDFAFSLELAPGRNARNLFAKRVEEDGSVTLSDPTLIEVTLAQAYEGNVSSTAELEITFGLRNLDAAVPVRGEFAEGTHFGVDIWLEGPLAEGETCVMVGGDRQAIKYADTVMRYQGSKAQHITPWADEDYKNPDFLAALITAGELDAIGFARGGDRRDDDGQPVSGFNPGIIGEGDLGGLDGLSQATLTGGETVRARWTQAGSSNAPLAQGDYLLHIVLNLDRGATYLTNNDVETCWGNVADADRGMHRLTIPVSLGDVAYEVPPVGTASELSGPDPEAGAARLIFLSSPVRAVWRP